MEQRSINEIQDWIRSIRYPENIDLVVAIGRGGIIPAVMVSQYIEKKLEILSIRFRDDEQKPMYTEPTVLLQPSFQWKGKNILLVDDVARTGMTLEKAKNFLNGAASIHTLTIIGNGDFSFHRGECFWMPWRMK